MRLASVLPVSGGSYAYAHTVLGPTAGWLVALGMGLEYLLAAGVLAIGFAAYLDNLLEGLGAGLPEVISESRLDTAGGGIDLPAAVIVLLLGFLLVEGIRESARIATVLVAIKVGALVLFVAVGSLFVETSNWEPFIPERADGSFGWFGVVQATSVVFFSFLGFDVVTTAGRETARPRRTVPLAVLGTLLITAALYVGVSLVMTGLRSYEALGVADPLSAALEPFPDLDWLRGTINVAAIVGLPVGAMASLLALSRMVMRLGADGALPERVARVNPRVRLPRAATLTVAIVVAAIAALAPLDTLASATSAGTLVAFIAVCLATLAIGRRAVGTDLPGGIPLPRVVPVIAIAACVGLLAILPHETQIIAGTWIAIGLVAWVVAIRRRVLRRLAGEVAQPPS
jgi:APA family basic amino acid/polyamine antiporter